MCIGDRDLTGVEGIILKEGILSLSIYLPVVCIGDRDLTGVEGMMLSEGMLRLQLTSATSVSTLLVSSVVSVSSITHTLGVTSLTLIK